MFKLCVQQAAAGDAFSVEERVRSDADHALRCGRLCAMWPCSWLMVLFQRFWRWLTAISRAEWLMADGPSGVGEVVMLGPGSIEHRDLMYCNIRKSTTFEPPWRGPSPK